MEEHKQLITAFLDWTFYSLLLLYLRLYLYIVVWG